MTGTTTATSLPPEGRKRWYVADLHLTDGMHAVWDGADNHRNRALVGYSHTYEGAKNLAAALYARDAAVELVDAIRPFVAMTFADAQAADARGQSPIFCQADVLNPCWEPGMPTTVPLRHWGYTPDMAGDGLACPDCRLRAALWTTEPRNFVVAARAAPATQDA